MGRYTNIKLLETRIRASIPYAEWVARNKAPFCLRCDATGILQCHHIVDMYNVLRGLWNLYGDEVQVYDHAILMHEQDMCEAATLCEKCHKAIHPGRQSKPAGNTRNEEWSAIPRNHGLKLAHSTRDKRPDALGLIATQILFAIGWYILNGHMESKMLELHRRKLARIIGKAPSTSFNKSLEKALKSLEKANVLLGSIISGNNVEIHMAPSYLESMCKNPWFVPMTDVRTSRMCILALRWFLGFQSKRKCYKIGLRKLCVHLGITTTHMPMAAKAVRSACDAIDWADFEIEKGMCSFELKKRGATPIFSLRQILTDSVDYGC